MMYVERMFWHARSNKRHDDQKAFRWCEAVSQVSDKFLEARELSVGP